MIRFSASETERYLRHIDLEGFGAEGQRRLKAARVAVVGAGGLGSPALLYLAAAGIGHLCLIDADCVSLSNLQRQVLHSTAAIGTPKVESARERLLALNPDIEVEVHQCMLTSENAREILRGMDFVIEATDNFQSKYLINDVCTELGIAFSIGGVHHYSGQTITCLPGTATYRDVFPELPSPNDCTSCTEAGILGVVPGVIGTIQATEAIKSITGVGELLTNRLLMFDAQSMTFNTLNLR